MSESEADTDLCLPSSAFRPLKIGIDIGGTFTDLVLIDDRKLLIHKILSTPKNPAQAVLSGIAEILEMSRYPANSEVDIVHGTTVATNALLEKKGAYTALITTKGFEDIVEIGRQNRAELYNFYIEKPAPLVPAELRFGISERTLYTGEILKPVNKKDIAGARHRLAQLGVESIAICFLFSYANPTNEAKVYKMLQNLSISNSALRPPPSTFRIPISVSHLIVPEYREYERFSTTVVNAYVTPLMRGYINLLEKQINGSLRIMQSNGGAISAKTVSEQPVHTILSGPAGGVVGALRVAKLAGFEKVITFDMGGTSTDVCLCDGGIKITTEGEVGGCPIKVPLIDIHTVGAGGGSIAYLDEGGALRVGPQSAGADPGPICYGKAEGGGWKAEKRIVGAQQAAPNSEGGNRLTVTDANVFLGRIVPDHFLGGRMKLDVRRVGPAMRDFARKLGYSPQRAAEGIIKVVNAKMERAIRVISIERGYDIREFALVSFGGAGGLHACELALSLSIPVVLIPKNAGALSAFGMLVSDVVKSYSQTVLIRTEGGKAEKRKQKAEGRRQKLEGKIVGARLAALHAASNNIYQKLLKRFKIMEERAYEEMGREGFRREEISFQRTADIRYEGQSYEINVPFDELFLENFDRAYIQRFGYSSLKNVVEVVNLRLKTMASPQKPSFYKEKLYGADPSKAFIYMQNIVISGNPEEVPVYNRELLRHGNMINGAAIIVEYSATTLIPIGFVCRVDEYGNLLINPME